MFHIHKFSGHAETERERKGEGTNDVHAYVNRYAVFEANARTRTFGATPV